MPGGFADATTRVFWLQSQSWYADLRVPADRPVRAGAKGFADYADEELLALAQVQGFAGQLLVKDATCLWRRDLDLQPPPPTPDEARWRIEGEVLTEDGLHLDYQEIWRRQPASQTPLAAFRLVEGPAPGGLLILGGDWFLEVLDRPAPLPAGETLETVVAAELRAGRRTAAIEHLSMRFSLGRIAGGAPWRVELSSYPWTEGDGLYRQVRLDQASGRLEAATQDGRRLWASLDEPL